jgi:hypothetical protein
MVIKCPKCKDPVSMKPVGMNDKNQFLYDFECLSCGTVSVMASTVAYMNWDRDYVNRRLYPVITQYIAKMLTCDVKCTNCEFRNRCYKAGFFFEVDKDQLRDEHTDDDEGA